MRRGARLALGSLNMVTTQRAEGFSPPTTKGTKPAISVVLRVVLFVLLGIVQGQEGGLRRGFPFFVCVFVKDCFQSLLMNLIRCNRKIGKLCLL